jgi:hypothetical protein
MSLFLWSGLWGSGQVHTTRKCLFQTASDVTLRGWVGAPFRHSSDYLREIGGRELLPPKTPDSAFRGNPKGKVACQGSG